MAVVTMAAPRPVVTLTLIPPIMLQTAIYHSMLFLPYLVQASENGKELNNERWPILGCKVENDGEGGNEEDTSIGEESRSEEEFAESFDLADRSLLWCWEGVLAEVRGIQLSLTVQGNDHRAELQRERERERERERRSMIRRQGMKDETDDAERAAQPAKEGKGFFKEY
jgi:hypothetical protein